MNILEYYFKYIIARDLFNKFHYKNTKELPQLSYISLNFGYKTNDLKNVASALLALKLIAKDRASVSKAKKSNLMLRIRKGQPAGCVARLDGTDSFIFLDNFTSQIAPSLKDFTGLKLKKNCRTGALSLELSQLIVFKELERQFYLFNDLEKLNVTFVTTAKTYTQFRYLLSSLRLPF